MTKPEHSHRRSENPTNPPSQETVMTIRTETKPFDVTAFVAAIEGRDAAGQIAAFSDNAELTVIDHEHPPSNPLVMRGTEALSTYFTDVCSRDMTHKVTTATATD